jgi:hypothetical protein
MLRISIISLMLLSSYQISVKNKDDLFDEENEDG